MKKVLLYFIIRSKSVEIFQQKPLRLHWENTNRMSISIQIPCPCIVCAHSSDWLSSHMQVACSCGGSKKRWRKAAMASLAWPCVAFSAEQGAVHGESAVRPTKGQACQAGSVRVSCGVASLECAVSQGRSGAGRSTLFGGIVEKQTFKCCPLKLLWYYLSVCIGVGLIEQVAFLFGKKF